MTTAVEQVVRYCKHYDVLCAGANERGECNTTACWNSRRLERSIDTVPTTVQMPPAEPKTGRDCTEFVRWLMDEVMDEENWQLNAVANGEIICRKLKKLGLLDVVDGYYVETQKTGVWIHDGYDFPHGNDWIHCSVCGKRGINVPADLTNFCPNCGSKMEE